MQNNVWAEGLAAFSFAAVYATFTEYVVHRLMHAGLVSHDMHAMHHQEGTGKGWYQEFLNYCLPSVPFLWVGFLCSVPAGIGFGIAGTLAILWAAYAHQLQLERPEPVFWLPRPVHHLHHKHRCTNTTSELPWTSGIESLVPTKSLSGNLKRDPPSIR